MSDIFSQIVPTILKDSTVTPRWCERCNCCFWSGFGDRATEEILVIHRINDHIDSGETLNVVTGRIDGHQ